MDNYYAPAKFSAISNICVESKIEAPDLAISCNNSFTNLLLLGSRLVRGSSKIMILGRMKEHARKGHFLPYPAGITVHQLVQPERKL